METVRALLILADLIKPVFAGGTHSPQPPRATQCSYLLWGSNEDWWRPRAAHAHVYAKRTCRGVGAERVDASARSKACERHMYACNDSEGSVWNASNATDAHVNSAYSLRVLATATA